MATPVSAAHAPATGARREENLREIKPLPWPPSGARRARGSRPHAHRCTACSRVFACPGPDDTGLCAPVCQPCYWLELGRQLRIYKAVVGALDRRRARIERRIGKAACLRARAMRQKLEREQLLALSSKTNAGIYGESDRAGSPEPRARRAVSAD